MTRFVEFNVIHDDEPTVVSINPDFVAGFRPESNDRTCILLDGADDSFTVLANYSDVKILLSGDGLP